MTQQSTPRYSSTWPESLCSYKNLYGNVYSTIVQSWQSRNNPNVLPFGKWILWYTQNNGVLLTNLKEQAIDTRGMGKSHVYFANWKKPDSQRLSGQITNRSAGGGRGDFTGWFLEWCSCSVSWLWWDLWLCIYQNSQAHTQKKSKLHCIQFFLKSVIKQIRVARA